MFGNLFNPNKAKKKKWEKGKQKEIDFWSEWIKTKGFEWPQDYINRLDSNLPFQDYLIKYLPEGHEVSILDVGAGPLTALGKKLQGYKISLTAVDPLANEYDEIQKKFGVTPLIRTQYCEAERLSEMFSPNSFDLVCIFNALDHCYDPVEGIKQMLHVLKKGRFIFMSHFTNEAEKESYKGFHQWNFCRENDYFVIWNRKNRIPVNDIFKEQAYIQIAGDNTYNLVEIRKY
jgi:SAM-dependent methyltransferase